VLVMLCLTLAILSVVYLRAVSLVPYFLLYLLIIYICNYIHHTPIVTLTLFADDAKLHTVLQNDGNPNDLQHCLDAVSDVVLETKVLVSRRLEDKK